MSWCAEKRKTGHKRQKRVYHRSKQRRRRRRRNPQVCGRFCLLGKYCDDRNNAGHNLLIIFTSLISRPAAAADTALWMIRTRRMTFSSCRLLVLHCLCHLRFRILPRRLKSSFNRNYASFGVLQSDCGSHPRAFLKIGQPFWSLLLQYCYLGMQACNSIRTFLVTSCNSVNRFCSSFSFAVGSRFGGADTLPIFFFNPLTRK